MLINFVLTHIFNLCFCFLFLPTHGRLHYTSSSSLVVSQISVPPSPAPAASVSPSYNGSSSTSTTTVFNVRNFGAVGNGVTDDTQAFKMAWDSACQIEDSEVLVPKSHSYMLQSTIFTGPCKSGLKLQIDGTLVPPDGPDSWPKSVSKRQWLVFYKINGMSMQGDGVIDGRGEKWWNLPCKPHKVTNKPLIL